MLGAEVRRLRTLRGLTQAQLAEHAGVSRALISAVEAGRHLPRVDAAARLATALTTTVEALLGTSGLAPLEDIRPIGTLTDGAFVQTARVGERLVCVPALPSADGWASADAQVHDGRLHRFDAERSSVIVAGCEPAIGLTARLIGTSKSGRIIPVATSSAHAIELLTAGLSHAVTVHGPARRQWRPPVPVRRWHIARWQVGLAASPLVGSDWLESSLAGRMPVAQREAGAGSQAAFERARRDRFGPDLMPVPGPIVAGHTEAVERASSDGITAVTIEPIARAAGLRFHPFEVHVSELWVASEHAEHTGLDVFLAEMTSARVQRRLSALGGYDLTDNGAAIAA